MYTSFSSRVNHSILAYFFFVMFTPLALGLVALLFWLLPIGIGLYYFLEVSRNSAAYSLACAFFFGMVFVYVQTVSNPYLNNPIGLSFVMMAIFSLRTSNP